MLDNNHTINKTRLKTYDKSNYVSNTLASMREKCWSYESGPTEMKLEDTFLARTKKQLTNY